MDFGNHQSVLSFKNKKTGFTGFIAIHNTGLGPALGGTRVFSYAKDSDGLKDALKLSKAMTYKCAIAGVPFGGGKAVIVADPKDKNILAILKQHAANVTNLNGSFYTGADVGLSQEFVEHLAKFCPYIIGTKKAAGDPSPFAGISAFLCAQVALKQMFGRESARGKTVVIKGVGKTGKKLAELFYQDGAKVIVADINPQAVKQMLKDLPGVTAIDPKLAPELACDIYAPCALGGDISPISIKNLKAKIICGTANNQLADSQLAGQLFTNGILHVPDYVANAGGLINVADQLLPGGYQRRRVDKHLLELKKTFTEILNQSGKQNKNPFAIADALAEQKFKMATQPVYA